MEILRDSLIAIARSRRVWLLQFWLNPVLIALGALWLLIPEAQAWHIAATSFLALVIVIGLLWLHAVTLAYFGRFHDGGSALLRDSLQPANLIAFTLWAAIFVFLLHFVDHASGEFEPQLSSYLRSISPGWLRRTISEPRMDSLVALKFWVLFWVIIPGLLLPFGLQTAKHGFGGFGKAGRRGWRQSAGNRVYWSVLIVLAIAGAYLPQWLIAWLPKMSSVTGETISMVLRLLLAWSLAVTAWTVVVSVLGRLGSSDSRGNVIGETAN